MKNFFALISVFLMLFCLCGCSFRQAVSRSGTEYIVSAIGFDQRGNELSVVLETIVTKTEDSESQSETKLLKGTGDSVYTAFADALKYATEPIYLSHLGVAVMGESLDSKNFQDICNWFYNKQDTTLSTFFITTKNAEELLSKETVSSIAVGYDLVGLLEQKNRESGSDYQNRFYKIEALRYEKAPTFALPRFTYQSEKFYLEGVTVFKNSDPQMFLNPTETVYYLIGSKKQKTGTLLLDSNPVKLISSKTKYSLKKETTPTVVIDISLKSEHGTVNREKVKQNIEELFKKAKEKDIDIFNLSEIVKTMDAKTWQNLIDDPQGGIYNLNIEVTVND